MRKTQCHDLFVSSSSPRAHRHTLSRPNKVICADLAGLYDIQCEFAYSRAYNSAKHEPPRRNTYLWYIRLSQTDYLDTRVRLVVRSSEKLPATGGSRVTRYVLDRYADAEHVSGVCSLRIYFLRFTPGIRLFIRRLGYRLLSRQREKLWLTRRWL